MITDGNTTRTRKAGLKMKTEEYTKQNFINDLAEVANKWNDELAEKLVGRLEELWNDKTAVKLVRKCADARRKYNESRVIWLKNIARGEKGFLSKDMVKLQGEESNRYEWVVYDMLVKGE